MEALMHFWLQRTDCDAILSSSLMSKPVGYLEERYLQTVQALISGVNDRIIKKIKIVGSKK